MTESAPLYTNTTPLTLGERPFWMPMIVEHCDDDANLAAMRFDLQVLDVGRAAWREMMFELDAIMADGELAETDRETAVAELLLRVVVGWRHVIDEQKRQIEFSPSKFGRLLDIQGMGLAIVQAYDNSCPRAVPGTAPEL